MNVVLWIAQILLAGVFLASGAVKLVRSKDELLGRMPALQPYRPITVKAIGLAEVLGAIGLIVPRMLGVAPDLVPWAALGLGCVAIGAAIAHAEQRDYKALPVHAVLLVLAVTVVVGRSAHLPL